ncbi:MAG: HlyD family secretion protein [Deltaproteobacteria bacterium]|nr:HlyD family secretion protein [Deltaproteobacteria bacterium]
MDVSAPKNNMRNRLNKLKWVGLGIVLLAVALALYWLLVLRYRVTTDDAYVHADSAQISSRVDGTVLEVMVDNDFPVERGQVLLQLDPRDFEVAVEQAQGTLARTQAEVRAMEISVSVTDIQTAAQLSKAEAEYQGAQDRKNEALHRLQQLRKERDGAHAEMTQTQRDYKRFESLYQREVVPEERRDQAETAMVKARSTVEATDAQIKALQASLKAIEQQVQQAQAQLKSTKAELQQVEIMKEKLAALYGEQQEAQSRLKAAQLELSYTTVTAPISGYIAQKSIQLGDSVKKGQPLMAVVPLHDVYVEANFKESQLKNVRLGQPAVIEADIYPGYIYHGKVSGIRAGTGAAFALLPPENATGNWIKVVQRVPVKINLTELPPPDRPLRVGLSLYVTISTRDRTGKVLVPLASNK